jgi:hypothetical protein
MSASAEVIVTLHNNTPKEIRKVSGSYELPSTLGPGKRVVVKVPASFTSSDVQATYASGQSNGGCKFRAGHKENSTGPVYSSSSSGYGQVSNGACFIYVTKKWTKPYNYEVLFMMSQ